MDRYRSSAHLANFQVHSLLNRSKKKPVVRSWKRALKRSSLLKLQWFALLKFARSHPLPPHPVSIKYVCTGSKNCHQAGRGRGVPPSTPCLAAFFSYSSSTHNLKSVQIVHFYAFFKHFYGALLSLDRSWADCTKLDFVSLLIALRSLSQGAPSLPKSRFAQEQRAIEWFQRAMCPALWNSNRPALQITVISLLLSLIISG